jgi:CHAT domain-containing protein
MTLPLHRAFVLLFLLYIACATAEEPTLKQLDARMSGLVLSTVNEDGRSINGYLRLVDIYKLNLDADLVVLSACQTGMGSIREGEGLQGLYQGFIMAGSRTVLNTLWSVDDEGTATFMRFFYDSLMSGSSPKKALSDAQQAMAASTSWSEPFYWAGFQLVSP